MGISNQLYLNLMSKGKCITQQLIIKILILIQIFLIKLCFSIIKLMLPIRYSNKNQSTNFKSSQQKFKQPNLFTQLCNFHS
ncbi:hypothetical protein pb186bvf_018568 [Paramecium bursaria]